MLRNLALLAALGLLLPFGAYARSLHTTKSAVPQFSGGSLAGPGSALPGSVAGRYSYDVAGKSVKVLRLTLVLKPQMRLNPADRGQFRVVNGKTVAVLMNLNNLYTARTRSFRFSLRVMPNAKACKCPVKILEVAQTGNWVKRTQTEIFTSIPER